MKYFVTDEDGKQYEIQEQDEVITHNAEETHDEAPALTDEEIAALKSLAAIADKLSALVSNETTDEDEITDEDENEEVVDTDEETDKELAKAGACDSRKSFGAKEKRMSSKVDDSIEKNERISQAWAKRGIKGGN